MSVIKFDEENKLKGFLGNNLFKSGDLTGGIETELQTAVVGKKEDVDLPRQIKNSVFYNNLIKRTKNGEYPPSKLKKVNEYLDNNDSNVWENSYVIVKNRYLNLFSKSIIDIDLLSDKTNLHSPIRGDAYKYKIVENGETAYRIPVSYLLKIALADYIGEQNTLKGYTAKIAKKIMEHFSNDNTSPEVISFYISEDSKSSIGDSLGRESSKRFLLTQLLTLYSNKKFRLKENGQEVLVYHSPLTPIRQQILNELIPDSFYRELFISPCLSGWDRGEEKKRYMELCHLSLSRSNLNAIEKLKDAGIIKNNLIILPNTSNTSLTNNGIHISIGSKFLTKKLKENPTKFNQSAEKYYSDLVIKIVEHFIPLLTVNYSASPYRIPFHDTHPEKILGFLPHELDFTHLRMLYRRWTKKIHNKRFGHRFSPVGPLWIDKIIENLLMLKGDYIPDYRIIDYFVSILSTETAGGLDGKLGNQLKLKKELQEMGVFDERLAFYSLYRGRFSSINGYTGFEGRFYSCFYDLFNDTKHSANLQTLFTSLAYKYIKNGTFKHSDIPDEPHYESERRQIFFAASIGIPTCYIRANTKNNFIKYILQCCKKVRASRRYPGYIRIEVAEYFKAIFEIIIKDASDLIENLNIGETIKDLFNRINDPKNSTANKITSKVMDNFGKKLPLDVKSEDFNFATEKFYRNELRLKHMNEGIEILKKDLKDKIENMKESFIYYVTDSHIFQNYEQILNELSNKIIYDTITIDEIINVITLCVLDISMEINKIEGEDRWKDIAI